MSSLHPYVDHPRGREDSICYRAHLFGPFHFFRHGQLIRQADWHGTKVKSLLKLFLIDPGKIYSTDQLSDLLWPTLDLKSSVRCLHVSLHTLRRLLEPSLVPRQPSKFILRNEHFYWFQMEE